MIPFLVVVVSHRSGCSPNGKRPGPDGAGRCESGCCHTARAGGVRLVAVIALRLKLQHRSDGKVPLGGHPSTPRLACWADRHSFATLGGDTPGSQAVSRGGLYMNSMRMPSASSTNERNSSRSNGDTPWGHARRSSPHPTRSRAGVRPHRASERRKRCAASRSCRAGAGAESSSQVYRMISVSSPLFQEIEWSSSPPL